MEPVADNRQDELKVSDSTIGLYSSDEDWTRFIENQVNSGTVEVGHLVAKERKRELQVGSSKSFVADNRIESRPKVQLVSKPKYNGEMVGNERHGYGVAIYEDGEKYEGEWAHDKINGMGKASSAKGDVYVGEVKNV